MISSRVVGFNSFMKVLKPPLSSWNTPSFFPVPMRIHDLFIIIIDVLEIKLHTVVLFDHLHRVLDDSECAESQKVHL